MNQRLSWYEYAQYMCSRSALLNKGWARHCRINALFLSVFGNLFSIRSGDNENASSTLSGIHGEKSSFEIVFPLMRGLVALAKKIPSKLVDAGIIWQVLPMILVPLIAQEGSPNEEKDPTENSDPFDAVALMAMQCLSLLAQREKIII